MKTAANLIALCLLFNSTAFAASTESSPITGDDIAELLQLNAHKDAVLFKSPKLVTLHWESMGQSNDLKLKSPTSSVRLMRYIPSDGGAIKPLHFWISSDDGSTTYSSFSIDTSKAHFWKSQMVNDVFTVTAYETVDFTKPPVYKIEIFGRNP
jgi:hypothetical protein